MKARSGWVGLDFDYNQLKKEWVICYAVFSANGRYVCKCATKGTAQKIKRALMAYKKEGRT